MEFIKFSLHVFFSQTLVQFSLVKLRSGNLKSFYFNIEYNGTNYTVWIVTNVCLIITPEYISMKRGPVRDCSMTSSAGSLLSFERLLAKLCPDLAVGSCSRWQCIELQLVQIRMAAVKIRKTKALMIPPAVQSKLVHSSCGSYCRGPSVHFCITGFLIFSKISEKLPSRGVSRTLSCKSSTISWANATLSFLGVAPAISPKTSLHNIGCVISFTAPLP